MRPYLPERDIGIASVRVDHASVRGDGVPGEVTNASNRDYGLVSVDGVCFASNGTILTWFASMIMGTSLATGESTRFAANICDNVGCSRFVVIAGDY